MKPKYLFFDIETTGLDPNDCVILEVAAAITDVNLNVISKCQGAVSASKADLDKMDEWCLSTHTKSGLLKLVQEDSDTIEVVEQNFINWVSEFFGENPKKVILAGNSIHFDRSFVKVHMPALDKILHYRMIDVSSFGIVVEDMFGMRKKKVNAHRAMADVNESIEELKDYIEFLTVEDKPHEAETTKTKV